jgi:hypothetical protein
MERLDSNQQKPSKQMFLISFSFIPADAGKGRAGNHLKAGWIIPEPNKHLVLTVSMGGER